MVSILKLFDKYVSESKASKKNNEEEAKKSDSYFLVKAHETEEQKDIKKEKLEKNLKKGSL